MSEQISVTLSEENIAWLDANYNNRSGYLDDLLTQAREGTGEIDEAIKRFQIEQLKADIAGAKSQLETKEARLNSLQAELESKEQEKERELEKAKDILEGANLTPDNPAVEKWADKVDMTPEQLIEEMQ